MSSKPSAKVVLIDAEFTAKWKSLVVAYAKDFDPNDTEDWYSIWIGFCLAMGRRDLSDYGHYQLLGLPAEMEVKDEKDPA